MQKDNLILTERQLARKLGLPYSSVRNLRIQKKCHISEQPGGFSTGGGPL